LLQLDDLMTSYTNAGAPELAPRGGSRPRHGLRTPRVTMPHLADVAMFTYRSAPSTDLLSPPPDRECKCTALRHITRKSYKWSSSRSIRDPCVPRLSSLSVARILTKSAAC